MWSAPRHPCNQMETNCFIEVEVLRELIRKKLISAEAVVALAAIINLQKQAEGAISSLTAEAPGANGTTPAQVSATESASAKSEFPGPITNVAGHLRFTSPPLNKNGMAAHYDVGVRTIEDWMKKGWLPYTKIGGIVRFDRQEVDAALKKKFGRNQITFSAGGPRQ